MLELIVAILFGSYASACFIRFLDFGMSKESGILGVYYKWLMKFAHVHTRRNSEGFDEVIDARWYYYPLGGCVYCMGFWVSLFPALACAFIYGKHPLMILFIFLAFQGITFRLTEKQENEL